MSLIQSVIGVACLVSLANAFLFGGGGGCGCAPPPPPPCLPPLPQPCLPALPPPPPLCLPSLPQPCLPRLSLPSPCGCGRKKRSVVAPIVNGQSGANNESLCNNQQIRRIILKNLSQDPVQTKNFIHSELKARLGGEYVVVCSQGAFSFVADAHNFCIDGSQTQTCYVFQTSQRKIESL